MRSFGFSRSQGSYASSHANSVGRLAIPASLLSPETVRRSLAAPPPLPPAVLRSSSSLFCVSTSPGGPPWLLAGSLASCRESKCLRVVTLLLLLLRGKEKRCYFIFWCLSTVKSASFLPFWRKAAPSWFSPAGLLGFCSFCPRPPGGSTPPRFHGCRNVRLPNYYYYYFCIGSRDLRHQRCPLYWKFDSQIDKEKTREGGKKGR